MSLAQLNALARQIERSNPSDSREQAEILEHLRELRDGLARSDTKELAGCLDAAGLMTEYLMQMGGLGPDGILRIVLRLVNVVRDAYEQDRDPAARSTPVTPGHAAGNTVLHAKADAEPGGLRMISDLVLGEILVQLRAVTPEQIKQALRLQRASGKHIGETLVELGATEWDQVQHAMRIQEHVRRVSDSSGFQAAG